MEQRYKSKYGFVRVEGEDQVEADGRFSNLMTRLDRANAEIRAAFRDNHAYLERDEHRDKSFPVH